MSRRGMIVAGTALLGAIIVAAAAPFVLMLLPNPSPVRISDVGAQMPGTFVVTARGTFHVFPRAERVDRFPSDALVADPAARIWVKYRQLSAPDSYTLYSFEDGRSIAVARQQSDDHIFEIRPLSRLKTGRYYAIIPRESIYGGEDYFYFSVRSGSVAGGVVRTASP